MNEKVKKQLLLFLIVIVIAYGVWRTIFAIMNISLDDIKPFKYKGVTPKSDWYNWLEPMAKQVGKDYGIPWQAIMVQTALETGWGRSSLLSKYNNFGGIKSVKGDSSVSMATKEFVNGKWITINDGFATWETPYKGLVGYAKFFHKNKRYRTALKFPNDPYRFIEEIWIARYATDPKYVTKLHGMLASHLKVQRA